MVDGTQEFPTVILFKGKTLVFDTSQCFNKFGAKCFSEHDKCHIVVGQIRKICCKYGVNSVVLVGETFVPIMKIETMKVKQPDVMRTLETAPLVRNPDIMNEVTNCYGE